jgi:hypothetical protein
MSSLKHQISEVIKEDIDESVRTASERRVVQEVSSE